MRVPFAYPTRLVDSACSSFNHIFSVHTSICGQIFCRAICIAVCLLEFPIQFTCYTKRMPIWLISFVFYAYSVTRNYFENLVRALENGLSDVNSHPACSRATSSKSLGGGSSKGKNNRGKGTASKSSSSRNIDDSGHWSCEYCTFANVKSAIVCQMCQQRRWTPSHIQIHPGQLI